MTLCTLSDIKALLGITDSSQDAKLNIMIQQASALIVRFLGYPVARATYTDEVHKINNLQWIQLRAQPVQEVIQATIDGAEVTDYGEEPDDLAVGILYRGIGWCGRYYTRGMTYDPVGGYPDIKVSYVAGWYLPGDVDYSAGADDSLPLDITAVCSQVVIERYRMSAREAEGLKSYSEGDISYGFSGTAAASGALSDSAQESLMAWRRVALA